jgi:ABC-type lipoprotein release transport system permease subunit
MIMLLSMAWRNIWRNRWRSFVILLSIALGLFAGIAVLALYKGMMNSRLRTLIETESSHIQIHDTLFGDEMDPKKTIAAAESLIEKIRSNKDVLYHTARTITTGMLSTATGSAGVKIIGIIPEEEYNVTQLKKKIIDGDGFSDPRKPEIAIGKKLANKLKLKKGSRLVLTFTDTGNTMISGAYRVKAIYQSDNAPLDERNVYVWSSYLSNMLQTGNNVHEIAIRLKDNALLEKNMTQLKQEFPQQKVESWKELSPETDLMAKTVDTYSYIIIVIILFALSFGIVNTMLMAILERTREIGMMIALGTSKLRIFFMVVLETLLLTLAGAPVGIAAGAAVVRYYNLHGLDLSGMGKEMMRSFGYETMIYPEFPLDKLVGIVLIIILTALLASVIPSVKALRLSPSEALKK